MHSLGRKLAHSTWRAETTLDPPRPPRPRQSEVSGISGISPKLEDLEQIGVSKSTNSPTHAEASLAPFRRARLLQDRRSSFVWVRIRKCLTPPCSASECQKPSGLHRNRRSRDVAQPVFQIVGRASARGCLPEWGQLRSKSLRLDRSRVETIRRNGAETARDPSKFCQVCPM